MAEHCPSTRRRGVSLIEALVALAVMGFGMLSLVGVQATLRMNSDLSKQRGEASRIASEELEGLRVFTTIAAAASANGSSWDEKIVTKSGRVYSPPAAIGNTNYWITRTVSQAFSTGAVQATVPPAGQQKLVTVQVSWTDRAGRAQIVTLDTVIAGAAPVLAGLLLVPPRPSPTNQINGRNATIPQDAVNQSDGTSLFHPPGASGVSWYFNNITGLICIGGATCAAPATLVSGSVNFDLRPSPSSENPAGPAINLASGPAAMAVPLLAPQNIAGTTPASPQCYADTADSRPYVNYFCAVTPATNAGWGGQLNMNPTLTQTNGTLMTLAAGFGTNLYKVCRYTPGPSDYTVNPDHPKTYCLTTIPPSPVPSDYTTCLATRVKTNLINQNFLVIDGAATCPVDDAATPLVNGNTVQHQP